MVDNENKNKNNSSKLIKTLKNSGNNNDNKNISKYTSKNDLINYNDFLYKEEMIFNSVIVSLQKSIRAVADTQILISYLETMKEFTNMLKSVSENYDDLLFNIATSLKYEKIPAGRVICKFGEKGRKFYIILKGKCTILLPKEDKAILTQDDFYNFILRLKKYKEREILDKVLSHNKNTYPLEEDEFSWLRGEIDTLKGRINSSPFEQYLFKFAKEESIEDIENLDFDIWKIFQKDAYAFNSNKYEQKILNAEEYINNVYPISSVSEAKVGKEVIVWIYHNIISLKTGNKFGDMALSSSNQKRTASIVSDLECHLGILDKKTYVKCLKDVSDRANRWNMNFILSQKVFSCINPNIFQRNYFNNFVHRKLNRGDFLIKQGQEADKIFVIKDGQYEVTIKRANMDLFKLIKKLGGDSGNLLEDFNLIHENKDYVEFMTLPKIAKLEIINETDIIGLSDIIIDNEYIFSIQLTSIKGEIFELQRKFFEKMVKANKDILENSNEECDFKRNYWIERIKTIVESRVKFFKTYKQEKIFKDEEKTKEQNIVATSSKFNDMRFKRKIILNSTVCLSSNFAINNPMHSIKEKSKVDNLDKKNNSLDKIVEEIRLKIYEKAMKQHPDQKRKDRVEKLKKLKKYESDKLKMQKNIDIKTNSYSNKYYPNDINNIITEDDKLNWKNTFRSSSGERIGRNTYDSFKTGLTNDNYISTHRLIREDKNFTQNYFSIEKINQNQNLLKKEILNNLIYSQISTDRDITINKSNFKESNNKHVNIDKYSNNKHNNHYVEHIDFIDNSRNFQISFNQYKNNSNTLNNMEENSKNTQFTISVEKTHNNENFNDLMIETEPDGNSNQHFSKSNFFLTSNPKKMKENKIGFEAPIFAGINVTRIDYNIDSLNINTNKTKPSNSKNLKPFDLRIRMNQKNRLLKIKENGEKNFLKIDKQLNEENKNFENKENKNNKSKETITKKMDSFSYYNCFNNFNDASLSSLSKLKLKDKTITIPVIKRLSNNYTNFNFKNKIKKSFNEKTKITEFLETKEINEQIDKTENFDNECNSSNKEESSSNKKRDNLKPDEKVSYQKNLSLSNEIKKFSRNSNSNLCTNVNVTKYSINAMDKENKIYFSSKNLFKSSFDSNQIIRSFQEEDDDNNNIINSNNSFEKKQIGPDKININSSKDICKINSHQSKFNNEKSNNIEFLNINDNYNCVIDHNSQHFKYENIKKHKIKVRKNVLYKNSNISLFNENDSSYSNNHLIKNTFNLKEKAKKNLRLNISNEKEIINKNNKSSFYNSKTNLKNYETFYDKNDNSNLKNLYLSINDNLPKLHNSSTSINFYPKTYQKNGTSLSYNNSNINLNNVNSNKSSEIIEEKEQKKKMYLMDELDRATRLSKFDKYTTNQDINKIVYDKIFSKILILNESSNLKNHNINDKNVNTKKDQFIDYLAIDKFNETYLKSCKNTIGFFNNKSNSNTNINLKKAQFEANFDKDHSGKIKYYINNSNDLFESIDFEKTKYSNFLSKSNFGGFNNSIRFKSSDTSRFLMNDKAKRVYQPKKFVTIVTRDNNIKK